MTGHLTVSAFAPICNPAQSPWGQKAFSGYLGSDRDTWQAYDATVLAASYSGPPLDVLIVQGGDDQFLSANQLLPDNLIAVCSEKKIPVVFRVQPVGHSKGPPIQEPSDAPQSLFTPTGTPDAEVSRQVDKLWQIGVLPFQEEQGITRVSSLPVT
ncbi:hypothetical protein NQZ68_012740 [Dissostichus eleginoides]|nr:hypothetical protein NQZ68_012740 [Dissostichus eleginoides]